MVRIRVDQHEVEYSSGDAEYVGDDETTLVLEQGEIWNLRVAVGSYVVDVKLLAFAIESDSSGRYAHVHHLDIPPSLQGQGFGKLCLALFYAVLDEKGIDQFSLKFGGGEESRRFLESLGFANDILYTSLSADFIGDSVMVGDFKSTGERDDEWVLYPVSLTEFPTEFFSLS